MRKIPEILNSNGNPKKFNKKLYVKRRRKAREKLDEDYKVHHRGVHNKVIFTTNI